MTHNQKLKQLLNTVKFNSRKAATQDELMQAVSPVAAFEGAIEFDNTVPFFIAMLAFPLWFLISALPYFQTGKIDVFALLFVSVLTIAGGIAFLYGLRRNNNINLLADEIFSKKIRLDNKFKELVIAGKAVSALPGADQDAPRRPIWMRLTADARNVTRKLQHLIEGQFDGNFKSFTFYYFNADFSTHVDSADEHGSLTQKYSRSGIYFPFENVKNLIVVSANYSKPEQGFIPISDAFDSLFRVKANSEAEAVKFINPAVAELFEGIAGKFTDLKLSIDESGVACLTCSDSGLLEKRRNYGFDDAENFIAEISGKAKIKKLNELLFFVDALMDSSK